jgi:hypothetical protein
LVAQLVHSALDHGIAELVIDGPAHEQPMDAERAAGQ